MKTRFLFVVLVCLLAPSLCAQVPSSRNALPPVTIMGPFPPQVVPTGGCPGGSGGSPNYCNYRSLVLPNINGVVFGLAWAQGNVISGTDVGIESNSTAGSYTWTGFDSMVNGYATQTCGANLPGGGASCLISIAMGMAEDHGLVNTGTGNTFTPAYVYSQATADANAPTWLTNTAYVAGQDVIYSGTYYQNTASTGSCTSTGSGGPTVDAGCTWSSTGAHAAPQDATFGSEYLVGTNALWPTLGNVANVNSANCTAGTSSCPTSTLAMGAPVTFETPVSVAWKNFLAAFFAHIAAASYSAQVRYVRSGIGQAMGESFPWDYTLLETLTGGTQTTLGNAWLSFHATYVKQLKTARDANFPGVQLNITSNGCVAAAPCSWATQEATNGLSIGAGLGTQSLQVDDIAAYWTGSTCSNNWCAVFQNYGVRAPFLELQELQASNTGGRPGTLDQFVPFGLQMRAGTPLYLEIVAADLLCAYVSGFGGANCPGTAPWVPFQQTLQGAAFGVPGPFGSGLAQRSH